MQCCILVSTNHVKDNVKYVVNSYMLAKENCHDRIAKSYSSNNRDFATCKITVI